MMTFIFGALVGYCIAKPNLIVDFFSFISGEVSEVSKKTKEEIEKTKKEKDAKRTENN